MAEEDAEEQLLAAVRTCLERVDNVAHTPRDLVNLLRINALVDLRFPLTPESLTVFLTKRPHVFREDTDAKGVVRFQLLHFVAARRSRTREKPVEVYPVAPVAMPERGQKRRAKEVEGEDVPSSKKQRGRASKQAEQKQESGSSSEGEEEEAGEDEEEEEGSNSDDSPLRLGQAKQRPSSKKVAKNELFAQLKAVVVRCTSSTRDHTETTGVMVCPAGNKLFIRCDCCGAIFTRCTWIGHCNNNTNRPLTHIHIVPPDRCLHDLFGPRLQGVRKYIKRNGSIAPSLQGPPRKNVIRLKMGGLNLGEGKRKAMAQSSSSDSFQSSSGSSSSGSEEEADPPKRPRGRPRKDQTTEFPPEPPAEPEVHEGHGPGRERKGGTDTKVWWGPGWQVPPPPPKEEHLRDRILWDCYQRPVVLGHSAELGYHYNGTRHSRIKVEKNYMEDKLLVLQNTKHKYLILVLADGHNGDQASTFFAEEASKRMEQLLRGGDSTGQEWDFGIAERQEEFRGRVRELYGQLDRQYLDTKRQAFAAWAQAHPHLCSHSPATLPKRQPRSTGRPRKKARPSLGAESGGTEGPEEGGVDLSVADVLAGDEALLAGITAAMQDMQQDQPTTLEELKDELRSLRYQQDDPVDQQGGPTPQTRSAPAPATVGGSSQASAGLLNGSGSEGEDYLPCYAQRRASLQRRPSGPYTGAGVDLTGDKLLVRPPSSPAGTTTVATQAEGGNGGHREHAVGPQASPLQGQVNGSTLAPSAHPQGATPQSMEPKPQPTSVGPQGKSVDGTTEPKADFASAQVPPRLHPDTAAAQNESVTTQPDSTSTSGQPELPNPPPNTIGPRTDQRNPQPDPHANRSPHHPHDPHPDQKSPHPDPQNSHPDLVTSREDPKTPHHDLPNPHSDLPNPQDVPKPPQGPPNPQPDTQSSHHNIPEPQLDAKSPQPDPTNPQPDLPNPQPDPTNPQPDPTNPQPDPTNPQPDLPNSQPDPSNPQPDLPNPQPDPSNPQPDLPNPQPDPSNPQPDLPNPLLDMSNPQPDPTAVAVKHEATVDPPITEDGHHSPAPGNAATDHTGQHPPSPGPRDQQASPMHPAQDSHPVKAEPQPQVEPAPFADQPPADGQPAAKPKRLRGRPPKEHAGGQPVAAAAQADRPARKRGRPKKSEGAGPQAEGAEGAGQAGPMAADPPSAPAEGAETVDTHGGPVDGLSDADLDAQDFVFAGGLTPDAPRPTTRQGRADYQKMRAQLRKLKHLGVHVPTSTSSPSPKSPKPPKTRPPLKAKQEASPPAPSGPPPSEGMQTPLRLRDRPLHRPESMLGDTPGSGGAGPVEHMVESPGGSSTVISTPERRVPAYVDDRPMDDGCTLVVNVLYKGWVVNCNVGDSRTVIATRPASSFRWSILFASDDQGLHRPDLVEHIVANGGEFIDDRTGRLKTFRVPQQHYHFLRRCRVRPLPDQAANTIGVPAGRAVNLGATMGDLLFKLNPDRPVLRCEPDVAFTAIPSEGKCLLLMASDGLFNYLPENLSRDRQQNEHLAYRVGYEYDVGYSLSSVCSRLVQREERDMSEFDDCMCLLLCVEQWAQKDDPTAIIKPMPPASGVTV